MTGAFGNSANQFALIFRINWNRDCSYREICLIIIRKWSRRCLKCIYITCVFRNIFDVGRDSLHIVGVAIFRRALLLPEVNLIRWAIVNAARLVANALTNAILSTILRRRIVAITFYGHNTSAACSTAFRIAINTQKFRIKSGCLHRNRTEVVLPAPRSPATIHLYQGTGTTMHAMSMLAPLLVIATVSARGPICPRHCQSDAVIVLHATPEFLAVSLQNDNLIYLKWNIFGKNRTKSRTTTIDAIVYLDYSISGGALYMLYNEHNTSSAYLSTFTLFSNLPYTNKLWILVRKLTDTDRLRWTSRQPIYSIHLTIPRRPHPVGLAYRDRDCF